MFSFFKEKTTYIPQGGITMTNVAYKRVMLKISGEALSGANGFGFDFEVVGRIAREVKTLVDGRRSWLSCWWRKHMER